MLAWLWRRVHGSEVAAATTPRRLVYALPQGSLVEPVANQVGEWLTRLGLIDQVALHLVPCGPDSGPQWRRDVYRPAIVIGCADYLVSKALNRAFGVSRAISPIDFALVINGAQWVFPDFASCRRSANTVLKLTRTAATAEPFAVTCLSAAGSPATGNAHVPYFRGRERQALAGAIGVTTGAGPSGPAASLPGLPAPPDLFDAAAFGQIDVAGYLDLPDQLEAQVIWATWAGGARPPDVARLPGDEWRCRAPLRQVDALARRAPVWRFDSRVGGWTELTTAEPAGPGEILLVAAADGGYDPVIGFDPESRAAVIDCPPLDPVAELSGASRPTWVSLRQHSEETRDQAAALLAALRPELPEVAIRAVECAGYLHDLGKAHPIWQDALCALAPDEDRERVEAGRPWAKSGLEAPLVFAGDVSFRHELASLLLIDGPLRALVDGAADRDLVRYLVLAHHGRLRVKVHDPDSAAGVAHGLEHGATWYLPPMLDQPSIELTVDLGPFDGDGDGSWAATVRGLLDRYGPFVLAYLETIVRIADWRASGGEPLP